MKSILLIISIFILSSCDKMEDNYITYLKNGEILYTPKPLVLGAKPGDNRIQFDWDITSNSYVDKWIISYDDESISFQNKKGNTHKQYIVDNVPEGNYEFSIISRSKEGNTSLPTVINSSVFGEEFRKTLSSRPIKSFSIEGVNALVNFERASDLTRLTKIKYINTRNEEVSLDIKKDSTEIGLLDLSISDPIQIQTFYRPTPAVVLEEGEEEEEMESETSIDEFASDWIPFVLPKISSVLESVVTIPILGGVKINWDNPESKDLKIIVSYTQIDGGDKIISKASNEIEDGVSLFYMDGVEQNIKISISDLFENSFIRAFAVTPVDAPDLDGSNWVVLSESDDIQTIDRWVVYKMFDEDIDSAWHTPWGGRSSYPHYFSVDMGSERELASFKISRRWDWRVVTKTQFEVSTDNVTWVSLGEFSNLSVDSPQVYALPEGTVARYFRVTFLKGTGNEAVIREFDVQGR